MRISALIGLIFVLLVGCTPEPTPKPSSEKYTKRIALTYDDAPRGDGSVYSGVDRTSSFIAQLEEANTGPVAIFVTTRGMNKQEGRQRIEAYAQAGHLIANHSDTHMWASPTPTDIYIADIDRAEEKLEGIPNRRPWYRFPYLDEGSRGEENRDLVKRDQLRKALADRGLISGYVTVDTFDWHLDRLWQDAVKRGAKIDTEALSKVYTDMVLDAAEHFDVMGQEVLGRRPAQVLLLHENDLAASFTVDLVRALRADGWTIISPDEAFADPIAVHLPKTGFAGMGRIAALAADAGYKGAEFFDHWSADEKGIETRLADDGVFTESVDINK
ncbi:MAG: polysaccharide deacetylase [Acidimicrobiales bacterium]|nr:polysaccharide deacetylase family protein [Hyphomonadaceae bacterium]RZV41742.1 MAG: polysaccharide deacetylase [Acidimicrobiales bacterium]